VAIKLKIPTSTKTGQTGKGPFSRDPVLKVALVVFLVLSTATGGAFA